MKEMMKMITTAAMHKEDLLSAWKDGYESLPNLASTHIRDSLEITGAISVTQADVFRIVTTAFESYASILHQTSISAQALVVAAAAPISPAIRAFSG